MVTWVFVILDLKVLEGGRGVWQFEERVGREGSGDLSGLRSKARYREGK